MYSQTWPSRPLLNCCLDLEASEMPGCQARLPGDLPWIAFSKPRYFGWESTPLSLWIWPPSHKKVHWRWKHFYQKPDKHDCKAWSKTAFSIHEADGFVNPWDYSQTEHDGIHGGQLSMEQHFRRVEIKTALATFSSQLNGEGAFSLGTAALLIRDVSVRFRYRSAYGCTKDKLSSIFLLVCGRTGR